MQRRGSNRQQGTWHGLLRGGQICVLLLLILTAGHAAPPPFSAQQLVSDSSFQADDVGYVLFDAAKGTVLEAHFADSPRIPASTTKIVTALAALHILGPDYRFQTSLFVTGTIQADILQGDLYLRGGGDPGLSTDDLHAFVAALKRAGIRRIRGKFIFDESFLQSTDSINAKQPAAVSYNPGLSALSLNYNRVQLEWRHRPGSTNFRTTVWSPAESGVLPVQAIQIGVLPHGQERHIKFLHAATDLDRWLLSRALPQKGWETLPVRTDPGRIAALIFRTLCKKNGISLPLPQAAQLPDSAVALYTHQSEPLAKLLSGVLRYSNNLSAELVGQVATRRLAGRPLSLRESASALVSWYRARLPEVDWQSFMSANHSGLSSTSRHTPRQLAAILQYGWQMPKQESARGTDFLSLLPPPRWSEGAARERVRVKSGTMHYADGLVGYLSAKSGRQLGFVILLTDFARRAALDAAFDIRFAAQPPGAVTWTKRAKKLERALVTRWMDHY